MEDISKPYIIGETAYIHEGNFSYLSQMVDEISEIGLDAVKYHLLLNPNSYMTKDHPVFEGIKKRIFSKGQWNKIFDQSNKRGLDIIALCDDVESVEYILVEQKRIKAVEIHATGLNDYHLLSTASRFPGPILLGVSGSTIEEIRYAVDFLKERNAKQIVLMYGFQSFPTEYKDINFSKMPKIKELFNLPVGYADHTAFDSPYNKIISILPAVMGFHILEKHYALNCGEKRIDYEAAVGKEVMLEIKKLMEIVLEAHGGKGLDYISNAELVYGKSGLMKKVIVAKKFIKKGEKFNLDNLWFKRTKDTSPLKQNQFLDLIGLEATKNIEEDEIIDLAKIKDRQGRAK